MEEKKRKSARPVLVVLFEYFLYSLVVLGMGMLAFFTLTDLVSLLGRFINFCPKRCLSNRIFPIRSEILECLRF